MGTKTIGLRDEVYERLKARKREGESFSDLVDRLLSDTTPEWREGFGTLPDEEASELESIVEESRNRTSVGLSKRQKQVLEAMVDEENDDKVP